MRGQDNKDHFSSFSDFPSSAFRSAFSFFICFHGRNFCVGSYKIITRISRFRCPSSSAKSSHENSQSSSRPEISDSLHVSGLSKPLIISKRQSKSSLKVFIETPGYHFLQEIYKSFTFFFFTYAVKNFLKLFYNRYPSRTRYLLDMLKTKSYQPETYIIDNYLVTYCHLLKISFLNI